MFEYKFEPVNEAKYNTFGQDGWELVGTFQPSPLNEPCLVMGILKRPYVAPVAPVKKTRKRRVK